MAINFDAVMQARERIQGHVHRTPILTNTHLNRLTGASLFFKCENFQKIGAFKARGACNAVLALSDERARYGVIAHSSGNHGAALARAAHQRGINAVIAMPENALASKVVAVRSYGAEVVLVPSAPTARDIIVSDLIAQRGAIEVHPFDDPYVIAGQGTAALELLEDVPDLDAVVVPIGGGGLLGGTALAVKGTKPQCKVYAVEPQGADDAYRSFISGHLVPQTNPNTICDGLRSSLGKLTFPLAKQFVEDIVTVPDSAIIDAMKKTWIFMKILVEPSSSVPLAALLQHKINLTGKRVGIILTGGNVDLDAMPW